MCGANKFFGVLVGLGKFYHAPRDKNRAGDAERKKIVRTLRRLAIPATFTAGLIFAARKQIHF